MRGVCVMAGRVLVVGGGGAVGRAILDCIRTYPALHGIAGLRRAGAAMPDARLVEATDARSLAHALRDCDLAVNAVGGPPEILLSSTRALCSAARQVGVRRLVHISSMAVYGGQACGTLAETAALAVRPNAYEAAKIECEAQVGAFVAAGGEAVILRPGLVFGPGSRQWAHRIARLLAARRLGDLGAAGDGFCNLTYEPDLGAGVVAALCRKQAAGAINLASASPLTWNAFLIAFARALGATPVRRLSERRLRLEELCAPALHIARRSAGSWMPDPLPSSLIRLFRQRMRLDPALADRLLGIIRTADEDAICATASGLRAA